MLKIFGVLTFCLLAAGSSYALDAFETVQCNANISQALIGKHLTSERVVVLEQRHKNIGLHDLGAIEVSDRLSQIEWQICGKNFLLLVNNKGGLIRDVLPFPPHSKTSPEFLVGNCSVNGKTTPDDLVAVLEDPAGNSRLPADKTLLPAKAAWKIDEKNAKFIQIPAEGLLCPHDGVITEDGGP